ncbi:MAG: LPS-assembly protein LptD [Bdellovibrio sp.]|nr:MAG: LPS-assembly protein LptD [Bdellovibrio sp.]
MMSVVWMFRKPFALFICLLLYSTSSFALMNVSGMLIGADRMLRKGKEKKIILEGNVQIFIEDQMLSCDKAIIDLKKKMIKGVGHVVIKNKITYSEAEEIRYNYEKGIGTLRKGYVQSGQVVFQGEKVTKTGKNTYVVQKGSYSACITCPPDWSFSGKKIEAEIGGYAWIDYPILKIMDVPVFILPKIVVPLKSGRQTGFLPPVIDHSSFGGTAISESFFWALSRNKDLTFKLKNYEKRGLKGGIEYRYVLTPESSGIFRGFLMRDRAFAEGNNANGSERGYMSYAHTYWLPNDYIQNTQLYYISDLRYLRDFPDELGNLHGDPALDNRFTLSHNTERSHISFDVSYYRNLLKADPLDNNDDAVHRFPEVQYSFKEMKLGQTNFYASFDLNYVKFARSFSFDKVVNFSDPQNKSISTVKGAFNPNEDLIRTGQRIIIEPQISYPINLQKKVDIVPSLTYNETHYRFDPSAPSYPDYSQAAIRRYLQLDVVSRTVFSRIFEPRKKRGVVYSYKHEIIPEVSYSVRPFIQRPNHVFFGDYDNQPYSRHLEPISDKDFRSQDNDGNGRLDDVIQFDYKDRLFNKNQVEFALSNQVIRKKQIGSQRWYKKIFLYRISQSYDFNALKREPSYPWSTLNSLMEIRMDTFETYTTAYYYPYAGVTNTSSRVRFKNDKGDYIDLIYSQNFLVGSDNEYEFDKRTEYWGTGVGYSGRYFNLSGSLNYSAVTYKVESWSTFLKLKPPGNCWGLEFSFRQVIGGDLNIKFNFNFQFGGV